MARLRRRKNSTDVTAVIVVSLWGLAIGVSTMDVDNEIDAQLLQQFSSMGTTDKDVLISEFQKLLGHQLNPAGCAFFLDMNNWNLQAAICAYYDYEMPKLKLPSMAFISDVTIGEGESVPPNTQFLKTWRVQNTGDEPWPPGCSLRYMLGDQLGPRDRVMLGGLPAKQTVDVSVEMVSPDKPGIYQGQWRMSTPTGMFFGEVIWVIITVAIDGLLSVTQQLNSMNANDTQASRSSPVYLSQPDGYRNPFEGSGLGFHHLSPPRSNSAGASPTISPFSSPVQNDFMTDLVNNSTNISLDTGQNDQDMSEDIT